MTTPAATPRTVGVEEEFLLLDPGTGVNAPVAAEVVARLPAELRRRHRREFRLSMLEMVTDVCTGLDELADQLLTARRGVATAAAGTGSTLVAIGATPVAEPCRTPADDPRFRAITAHYGPVALDPAVCGCHVHVGVPDRATAVAVCTRLRAVLPVVQALAANSPLFEGADTGYASWRSVQLDRWPGLGPAPHLESAAELDRLVATLVASGEMLDESMVLWHARPSDRYPTVEVRVADVCLAAGDAVVLAGLVRGLVDTLAGETGRAPVLPDILVRAAHWTAARHGVEGTLFDLRSGRARPAWDLIDETVDGIAPALRRHGDLDTVTAGLDRIRRDGTGAARQRRALDRVGDLTKLFDELAAATVAG